MRWSMPLLVTALLLFLGSAVLTLVALERSSRLLALLAILGMLASTVVFVLSIWLPRRRVDWERIRTEQRLWESGPLGRSWLRIRRRLSDLWKF